MNYWFSFVLGRYCGLLRPVCVIKPIVCAMVGLAASSSGLLCVLFLNENGIMFGN